MSGKHKPYTGPRCVGEIKDTRYVFRADDSTVCGKAARFEYGGKWYCIQHHPPAVAARRAQRQTEKGASA